MRLVPLEIGRLRAQLSVITGEDGDVVLPVPSWLIEHDGQLILFDTGLHREFQSGPERMDERTAAYFDPDFRLGEEVGARLVEQQVRPSDIGMVVLSHLHFDHCGGTDEIPDARVVVQRAEWEAGHEPRLIEAGIYNTSDYDTGHDVQLLDGEHDLFGDGRVVCLPTPGHTRGHQSLRVELDSGPVVLTADCIYSQRMLDDMIVPPIAGKRARARQLESMAYLQSLQDDQGCRLLFGHDEQQFRSLPAGGLV